MATCVWLLISALSCVKVCGYFNSPGVDLDSLLSSVSFTMNNYFLHLCSPHVVHFNWNFSPFCYQLIILLSGDILAQNTLVVNVDYTFMMMIKHYGVMDVISRFMSHVIIISQNPIMINWYNSHPLIIGFVITILFLLLRLIIFNIV